jgi:3-oxoacyl-[acyl-carrier-protein] synthase II
MRSEIVIVSIGLVDPLGFNLNDNFNKFINGLSGIRPIENFKLSDYPVIKITEAGEINVNDLSILNLKENEIKHLDRYNLAGFYAAEQALMQTKFNSNTGVIFSSLGGGAISTLNCTVNLLNNKRSTPRQCLAAQRDNLTSLISRKFNLLGVNVCITSACSSGIISLDYAYKLLEDNTYDQMLVGGCDLMVDPMDIYMFQSIGALDIRSNPKSCPFDIDRNGFVMGEGAVCFVLKTKSKAIKDNDRILATVRGIGYANEAFHETSVHPEGLGAKISIEKALEKSSISNAEVRMVSAHATSTQNGDEIEYNIIKKYFPNADIQAVKANIGHTMASCSLIELSYMIQSLNVGVTGKILNLTRPIGNEINFPDKSKKINSKFGIKNSFGFGGKSAAIILEKGYDY